MACPTCGCKVTYPFDDHPECTAEAFEYHTLERCAAFGAVFDIEDHTPEDDDEPL